MTEAELLARARVWATNRAYVLHRGCSVVGRASKVWAAGEYLDDNGRFVSRPVLGLDSGHALVLRADEAEQLVELTADEVEVFTALSAELRTLLTGALVAMGQRVKDPSRLPTATSVLQAALSSQLRAFRSGG